MVDSNNFDQSESRIKKPAWLSDEILTAIKERDRLKKELEKCRVPRETFKAARNKVVRLVEKAKKKAIIDEISNIKSKSSLEDLEKHFPDKGKTLKQSAHLE